MNNIELSIVPSLNPDLLSRNRTNAKGKDLNRDFPTWRDLGKSLKALNKGRQPETKAMIRWTLTNPFISSLNLHDGTLVVNFPWDDDTAKPWTKSKLFRGRNESFSPDHKLFTLMSLTYAKNHRTMQR